MYRGTPQPSGSQLKEQRVTVFLIIQLFHIVAALAPKDAEIFTVYSGSNPIVILNSPEVVHSAFVKNADFFSERTPYQQRPHSPGYVASGYTCE